MQNQSKYRQNSNHNWYLTSVRNECKILIHSGTQTGDSNTQSEKKMKKFIAVLLTLSMLLALSACNNTNSTETTTTATTTTTVAASVSTSDNQAGDTTAVTTPISTKDYSIAGAVNTEVTFGIDPFIINGTLSIPEDAVGKVPAILIVGGSGPVDRDGLVGNHKFYKELAEEFVKNGIAVLRFDKRTFTHAQLLITMPDLMKNFSLSDEYVVDSVEGYNFLAAHTQIDSKKIFIIGHSQGANVAPMISSAIQDGPAGVIMLAPNHTPMHRLLLKQVEFLANLDGKVDENEMQQITYVTEVRNYIDSPTFGPNSDPEKALGIHPLYWMEIKQYDPVASIHDQLEKTRFLVLHGSKDYQVPASESEKFTTYLSGSKNFMQKIINNADHIFHEIEGNMGPQNYTQENALSQDAIKLMLNFIKNW